MKRVIGSHTGIIPTIYGHISIRAQAGGLRMTCRHRCDDVVSWVSGWIEYLILYSVYRLFINHASHFYFAFVFLGTNEVNVKSY